MSLIDSIASFSTLQAQAELKMKVATKVMKMAQGQDQIIADMVQSAMEDVEEMITDLNADLGSNLDLLA